MGARKRGYSDYQSWWCAWHLKYTYPTKAKAKLARRQLHPSETMSVYPCEHHDEGYHLGHLPSLVKNRGLDRSMLRRDDGH